MCPILKEFEYGIDLVLDNLCADAGDENQLSRNRLTFSALHASRRTLPVGI
jgi:hypothetical protein